MKGAVTAKCRFAGLSPLGNGRSIVYAPAHARLRWSVTYRYRLNTATAPLRRKPTFPGTSQLQLRRPRWISRTRSETAIRKNRTVSDTITG